MDDKEFQLAVERLINAERQESRTKEPYILESLESERRALLGVFIDHYVALQHFTVMTTLDEIINTIERSGLDDADDEERLDELSSQLEELMQDELQKYPEVLSGEIRISGQGVYLYASDNDVDDDVMVDTFDDGVTINGEVDWYTVAPLPSDDTAGGLGLWVLLKRAAVINGAGERVAGYDEVSVPVTLPGLHMHKIIRQSDATGSLIEPDVAAVNIWTQFKNDFILDMCNSFENDLNYNDYDADEHQQRREMHQNEIAIFMSAVESDCTIRVSAREACSLRGVVLQLTDVSALYLQPVFAQHGNSWRVYHAFEIETEGGELDIVHVLPEHLQQVERAEE